MPTYDVNNTSSTYKGRDLRLLTRHGLFPHEQIGYHKGSKGTGELVCIDQHILNESKRRRKNLVMSWIDNKKAYDILPPNWIINCLQIYKISDDISFIEKTHENLKSGIDNSRRKSLAEAKIQRCVFQGVSLSPLLFVIVMMLLTHILRKCTAEYKFSKSQEKHLRYMDDIKLFAKYEKELETLIHAI